MATEKDSYLSRERKNNADYMRKSGNSDVLAMRKSIGRSGEKKRDMAKKMVDNVGRLQSGKDTMGNFGKPRSLGKLSKDQKA